MVLLVKKEKGGEKGLFSHPTPKSGMLAVMNPMQINLTRVHRSCNITYSCHNDRKKYNKLMCHQAKLKQYFHLNPVIRKLLVLPLQSNGYLLPGTTASDATRPLAGRKTMHGSTEHIFSAPLADLRSFNCDSTVNNDQVQHLEAPGSK